MQVWKRCKAPCSSETTSLLWIPALLIHRSVDMELWTRICVMWEAAELSKAHPLGPVSPCTQWIIPLCLNANLVFSAVTHGETDSAFRETMRVTLGSLQKKPLCSSKLNMRAPFYMKLFPSFPYRSVRIFPKEALQIQGIQRLSKPDSSVLSSWGIYQECKSR